jgi:hypothetical protein
MATMLTAHEPGSSKPCQDVVNFMEGRRQVTRAKASRPPNTLRHPHLG